MQYKSKKIFILSIVMLFFMVGITIFNQTGKSEAMTIINNKIYDYSYKTMFTTIRGRGFWTYNSKGKKVFMDIEYQDSITNVVFDQYALSGWVHIDKDDYYLTPNESKTITTGLLHYQDENKKMTIYGFGTDGKLLHGLNKINDNYYFMNDAGIVQTNTWKIVNGKNYYFNEHGIAYKNTNKIIKGKEYYFNNYAQLITGLFTDSGHKKYGTTNGILKNSWQKINGYWYYFDANGNAVNGYNEKTNNIFKDYKLQTGLQKINGYYFYVNTDHTKLRNTWKKVNGDWYYFTDDYCAYWDGEHKVDGVYYKFKNGKVQTGIQLVNKKYHYYNPNNAVMSKDRWIKSGNYWWYFDTNGDAVNNIQYIKGTVYVFKSYQLQTGLQTVTKSQSSKYAGVYYYYASKGTAAKGWTKLGNIWYYFDKTGKAYVNGKYKIDNEWYYFDNYGKMQIGVIKINGSLYYFAPNGKLITKTGWHKWNNNWYYVRNTSGILADNRANVQSGNKAYKFDKNGVCLNP